MARLLPEIDPAYGKTWENSAWLVRQIAASLFTGPISGWVFAASLGRLRRRSGARVIIPMFAVILPAERGA